MWKVDEVQCPRVSTIFLSPSGGGVEEVQSQWVEWRRY